MSLRVRLFLLFGSLLAILVLSEWWLARALSRDLSKGVDRIAFSVGSEVLARVCEPDETTLPSPSGFTRRIVVHRLPGERPLVWIGEAGSVSPRPGPSPMKHERSGPAHIVEERVEQIVTVTATPRGNAPPPPGVDPALLAEAARPPAGAQVRFDISLDRLEGARFLRLQGPNLDRKIDVPSAQIEEALDRFSKRSLAGSAAILALGLVAAAIVSHRVTTPLRELAGAARRLGDGNLGTSIPESGSREVREAIGAFNRMSERLQQLDARARLLAARQHLFELGEVARGFAHSLRNPLNMIGLTIDELAALAPAGSPAAPLAEAARRQIRRADGSIRSFLALSNSGSGVEPGLLEVGAIVDDVALEAIQEGLGGSVTVEVEREGEPVRILGVAPELRAVVHALVINAVEASPDGGRVTIRLMPRPGGGARIEVDDDGPGLPEEVRGRLFTPHVTTKPTGSGMGLFLAHRIAAGRYGGSLAVEDRDPRGTRARLELSDRGESHD